MSGDPGTGAFDPGSPSPIAAPALGRRPPPAGWRRGAAAVCCLTFDLDAETAVLTHGEHHLRDLSAMSHQAYGPRTGVPRILKLLRRHDLRATFFVPGVTAQRWPEVVTAILEAGHEVGCHGHTHDSLLTLGEAQQAEDLGRALRALTDLGARPRGYRAPNWQLTRATLELLPSHGIAYDSSLMDDDRPYALTGLAGPVAELPVHWLFDDWEQYGFLPAPAIGAGIAPPARLLEIWTSELDAMRATGSLCVPVCHPFLSGRPSRVDALERFVEHARARADVRFTTAGEVADEVLAAGA